MSKPIKYILYFLATITIIAVVAYFSFMNVDKVSAKAELADMTITSIQLFQNYTGNTERGDRLYIGKIIEVSGKVTEISSDEQGAPVVLFGTGEAFGGVLCTFEMGEKAKVASVKVGDEIKVKGICSGMIMEVVLNRCTLVQ